MGLPRAEINATSRDAECLRTSEGDAQLLMPSGGQGDCTKSTCMRYRVSVWHIGTPYTYRVRAIDYKRRRFRCNIAVSFCFITRRRSFTEYWKHFVASFDDVHAFGYNSAGSERIRMKFGVLRVYCLELELTDLGRDSRRSDSGRAIWNFILSGI